MGTKSIIVTVLAIVILGIVAGILLKYAFISTKDSVVNPKSYLGKNTNTSDIYGRPGDMKFYSPIS